MRRCASLILCSTILLALSGVGAAHATGGVVPSRPPEAVAGSYIVVYEDAVGHPVAATRALESALGFRARHTYAHALKGFAGRLTSGQVHSLRNNPRVELVAVDRRVQAAGPVPLTAGDTVPTGVRRVEAATSQVVREASAVNVAVIDSGVDLSHPDLNAAHGVNCVGTGLAYDDDGHGTHVAGTIAAKNDGAGVVGAAPATRIFAAKVLDASGSGSMSSLICGIDWVTSTLTDLDPSNDVPVANMSLGAVGQPVAPCATTTDPLHRAVCRSTGAGATYVVAAGNDGWDYDYARAPDVPAAYPEVLTVTAVSDGDGKSGGLAAPACAPTERDDVYASFSNYATTSAAQAHTIAAPGTCVRSTYPGGTYATMSGTSMAAPHVAGAVALCLDEAGRAGPCRGLSPAQIIAKMRATAESKTQAQPGYGFGGDPLRTVAGRYYGYLTWAGSGDATAPLVSSTAPAGGSVGVDPRAVVSVTFNEAMDTASAEAAFALRKTSDGSPVAGSFSWSDKTMRFTPSAPLAEGVQYSATVSTSARDIAGNRLAQTKEWSFKTITNVTASPVATVVQWGSWRTGGVAQLAFDDGASYEVNSTTTGTFTAGWYGRFSGVANSLRKLRVTYKGKSSRSCSQTISLFRWTTSSWVDVDARTMGTTPITVDKLLSGSLGDYVSGTAGDGELRLRVRCTTGTGSFVTSGDLMRIVFGKP